jgi:hypothetical protein
MIFWSAVLAAGVAGLLVATAFLVRSRSIPSLAQVIASAEAETVVMPAGREYMGGAGLRPGGEGKP